MTVTGVVDSLLDRSIAPGWSRLGLAARRRLPGWPADPPRMDGQTVLVTGAAGGLGLATAAGVARLGARTLLLGRNEERLAGAVRQVGPLAEPVLCDLTSLADLERVCSGIKELDVLVNNAGVLLDSYGANDAGVELTWATNVLAPFVLTDRLAGALAARSGRVVNVSSGGMYGQRLVPAPEPEGDEWHGVRTYARTKRAEVVLTELWAERLRGQGVTVQALHPGWAATPGITDSLAGFARVMRPALRTAEEGADTAVWLAGSPDAREPDGAFWQDRRPRPTHVVPGTRETDAERQELWATCVRQAGGLRSA